MDSRHTLYGLIGGGTVLMLVGVLLAIMDYSPVGVAVAVIGVVLVLVAILLPVVPEVRIEDSVLYVRAPFVDIKVPISSITAVELRDSFKTGMRTYGLGTFHGAAGDFCNKEFASYKIAANTKVPAFIVIRYGGPKVAVFNAGDAENTRFIYGQIASAGASCMISDPARAEENARKYRGHRNAIIGFLAVVLALTAVMLVVLFFFVGHADASLDDDSLHIDATMVHKDILYTDISSVELREGMDYGSRISGFSNISVSTGTYRNSKFGNYTLSLNTDTSKAIVVHLKAGSVVVFNVRGNDATDLFYADLSSRL